MKHKRMTAITFCLITCMILLVGCKDKYARDLNEFKEDVFSSSKICMGDSKDEVVRILKSLPKEKNVEMEEKGKRIIMKNSFGEAYTYLFDNDKLVAAHCDGKAEEEYHYYLSELGRADESETFGNPLYDEDVTYGYWYGKIDGKKGHVYLIKDSEDGVYSIGLSTRPVVLEDDE